MYFWNILFSFLMLNWNYVVAEYEKDTWVEPNAWARHSPGGVDEVESESSTSCPVCQVDDNSLSLIYFRKFVANLFSRNKMQYNEKTAQYHRLLKFTLSTKQLEFMDQLSDPRDMDTVLTEIFSNVKTMDDSLYGGGKTLGFKALILDIFRDYFKLLQITEVYFTLILMASAFLIWFLHRRYNKSIIGMLIASILLIGYLATYYQCNRKMETDELVNFLRSVEDPRDNQKPGFMSRFFSFFKTSPKEKRIEEIRNSNKIKLPFCRPDHVLMMYVNEMLFSQFESIIDKCMNTFTDFKNNLSFPYNIIAMISLPMMTIYIIKLFFKYILRPSEWYGVFNHRSNQQQTAVLVGSTPAALTEDRISGDNLKVLLNALKPAISSMPLQVSGVQEVTDQLKLMPPTETANLSSPSRIKKISNNNNLSKSESYESKTILEDCVEDGS